MLSWVQPALRKPTFTGWKAGGSTSLPIYERHVVELASTAATPTRNTVPSPQTSGSYGTVNGPEDG